MSDLPRIDLIVVNPKDDDDLMVLITVDGKMKRYVIKKRVAGSTCAEIATALAL